MCVNEVIIPNKSKHTNGLNYQPYFIVRCGKCEECKKEKQNEYLLRSFYEWKKAEAKGGYGYFDTLTYNSKHLPKYKGFGVFRHQDIVLFRKKLLSQLTSLGYEKGAVTYIITSEYGDTYFRPHYHLIFFVNVNNLPLPKLKRLINKCWTTEVVDRDGKVKHHSDGSKKMTSLGFTDSVYTAEKRVINSINALKYVTKYVTKDVLASEMDEHYKHCNIKFDDLTLKEKELFKNRHFESEGFGVDFLGNCDIDALMQTGNLSVDFGTGKIQYFGMPLYYKRKLFYELKKDDEGNKYWELNELGKQWKRTLTFGLINTLTTKYDTIYNNLINYVDEVDKYRAKIDELLDGRTFKEFAEYLVVYRGRVNLAPTEEEQEVGFCEYNVIPKIDEFVEMSLEDSHYNTVWYSVDKDRIDDILVAKRVNDDYMRHSYNSVTCEQFRGFDELYGLFNEIVSKHNNEKENISKRKNELIRVYKSLTVN